MYIKYPRTPYLPFSPSVAKGDRVLKNTDHFKDRDVVVTTKMDGESTTMYRTGLHARSLDSSTHPSRFWVTKFHSEIADSIPDGWRICGENMYAEHSIGYTDLPSYFLGFSIWDDTNHALSWDETIEYFELFGITPVDVLYRGKFNETLLKILGNRLNTETTEGFVIRVSDSFMYDDFGQSVAKWVRPDHIQTETHWMHSKMRINQLKSKI